MKPQKLEHFMDGIWNRVLCSSLPPELFEKITE